MAPHRASCICDADSARCIRLNMADRDRHSSVCRYGGHSSFYIALNKVGMGGYRGRHRYGHKRGYGCNRTRTVNGGVLVDIDCSHLLISYNNVASLDNMKILLYSHISMLIDY